MATPPLVSLILMCLVGSLREYDPDQSKIWHRQTIAKKITPIHLFSGATRGIHTEEGAWVWGGAVYSA